MARWPALTVDASAVPLAEVTCRLVLDPQDCGVAGGGCLDDGPRGELLPSNAMVGLEWRVDRRERAALVSVIARGCGSG